jgi:hypothetical protein
MYLFLIQDRGKILAAYYRDVNERAQIVNGQVLSVPLPQAM